MKAQKAAVSDFNRQTNFTLKIAVTLLCLTITRIASASAIGLALKAPTGKMHLPIWVLAFIPLLGLLAIMLHEAGHVLGGLLAGFRFYLYIAGPLRVERVGERLKIRYNSSFALWGGLAGCLPRAVGPSIRTGMFWMTAGGPVTSLLCSLPFVAVFAVKGNHPVISFLLVGFALMSCAIGVVTLIPNQFGGYSSDGSRLLMLLRNRPEGSRWTAMAALVSLSLIERPRNWPVEYIEMLGEGDDNKPDASSVCLLRYAYHADCHEWQEAGIWLERSLKRIDSLAKSFRGAIYSQAASFYARHLHDAAAARGYLELAEKSAFTDAGSLHSVRAAVLIAEGRG
jgi:hypothetical protein